MESRAATPIFRELPERSPEALISRKIPAIERVAKLSTTLARFARLKHQHGYLEETDPLNEKELEKGQEDYAVAQHEMGHVAVAEQSGASEISATVIPGPNYRGLTRAALNGFSSMKELLHARIRIALGGHVGEERGGQSDHSGTGSDMGTVNHLAEVLANLIYKGAYSPGQIISEEFSNARRMVYSCMNFDQRSMNLAEQGSIG